MQNELRLETGKNHWNLFSPFLRKFCIVELFRMLEDMQETAGFYLYVLLVEEIQIQPLF